jgi:membrane protease YdiL (CAAX protease family)
MSDGSSKDKKRGDHDPQAAPPAGLLFPNMSEGTFVPERSQKEAPLAGHGRLHWLRPKKDWGIITGAIIAFVALMGPWYVLEPVFKQIFPHLQMGVNLKVALATIVIELFALGIIAAALAAYGKKPRDIGFTKIRRKYIIVAAIAFAVYFAISLTIQLIARGFINGDEPQNLGYQDLSGREIIAAFLPLVILTPLAEETIFRGFLFKGFRRHLPFWLTALGVSALFGLAHGQWNVGLDVFVMSLVSCYLVERTKSIWPSIFLHVIKNGLAFWLLYLYNGH